MWSPTAFPPPCALGALTAARLREAYLRWRWRRCWAVARASMESLRCTARTSGPPCVVRVFEWFGAGKLRPRIHARLPLLAAREAGAMLERGGVQGKIVHLASLSL